MRVMKVAALQMVATPDVARNLECARAHGLSAYDSLYIELALRRRAALATYDAAMIAAAPRAGIRLFPHPQALPQALPA